MVDSSEIRLLVQVNHNENNCVIKQFHFTLNGLNLQLTHTHTQYPLKSQSDHKNVQMISTELCLGNNYAVVKSKK